MTQSLVLVGQSCAMVLGSEWKSSARSVENFRVRVMFAETCNVRSYFQQPHVLNTSYTHSLRVKVHQHATPAVKVEGIAAGKAWSDASWQVQ
jgi:hypothetical protein